MSRVRGGSTRRWRRLREFVLERDGWKCRAHLEGWCARHDRTHPGRRHRCLDVANVAHHAYGVAVTGDDPRYVVASCAPCNAHIGEPDPPGTPGADARPRRVSRW